MVGLDGTGKTTIRKMLNRDIMLQTEPTGGWGVSVYLFRWRFKEYVFSICEIGGNKNSRYLWRDFEKDPFLASFLPDVCGVIFVVDSSDVERMAAANELYSALVQELAESRLLNCLPALPVLVIANKQDLPEALAADEVFDQLKIV